MFEGVQVEIRIVDYNVRAKWGIIAAYFFRRTGNRSNKGRCITRITVFIYGVLCVHFSWAYQSPRKKTHRGAAFFRTRKAGLRDGVCGGE